MPALKALPSQAVLANGGAALSDLAYGRDEVGRIAAITDQVNPTGSAIYGYDPVGRLTMAVTASGAALAESYAYTPGTNRLASVTDAGGVRTVSYDARGNTVAENRADGTLVAASYDGHARLSGYDRSNIGAQAYTYNGLGDRVRVDKPTGSRHFVYDTQGRVLAEYGASAGEVWAEFIWALPPGANDPGSASGAGAPFGGGDGVAGYAPLALVAQNVSGLPELYWVHGNHLGVPQVTTNASGQVANPGDDFLRPGFPGQSQVLTDLYYNRARDYDPVLGRYIQADPIGLMGGANPYLYAGADPVNMIDPLGLKASGVRPSAGQLFDVALEWWAKRQIKHAATRRIPLAGQALSAGDALGASLAVLRFAISQDRCPGVLQSKAWPRGYWDGQKGAEEWGRRNGVGKDKGRRKFHDIKGGDTGSRGDDNYGVNPDTGDVIDPNGESVGNLND